MDDIPTLDRKGLREFGIVTGGIIVALFGFFFPWLFSKITLLHTYEFWGALEPGITALRWPFLLGGALAVWGLIAPMSLAGVYKVWMKFGLLMSSIMTPLILGTVFFFVFTPVALLMKIMGKDSMSRALDPNAETYRVPSKDNPIKNLEKPF